MEPVMGIIVNPWILYIILKHSKGVKMHDFKIGDPIQFLSSSGEWENGVYLKPVFILGSTNTILVLTSLYDTLRYCCLQDVRKPKVTKELREVFYKYIHPITKECLVYNEKQCSNVEAMNYKFIGQEWITFNWEE